MLQEKTFISDDVNYNMEQKEQEFHNQYKMIKENIEDFEKYKKAFHRELKEKKKKQQKLDSKLREQNKPKAEEDDFMSQVSSMRREQEKQAEEKKKKEGPVRMTPGMDIEELRAKVKEMNERHGK